MVHQEHPDGARFSGRERIDQKTSRGKIGLVVLHVRGSHRFVPHSDQSQLRERFLPGQGIDEGSKDGGARIVEGNLLLHQPGCEIGQPLCLDVPRIECCTVEESSIHSRPGLARAQRGKQRDAILGADVQIVRHSHAVVQDVLVIVHDPLGPPRRARGVQDLGQRLRRHLQVRILQSKPGVESRDVQDPDGPVGQLSRQRKMLVVGDQETRRHVLQHGREACRRESRVQRHVELARLQHSEHGGDRRAALFEEEGDGRSAPSARRQDRVCYLIGSPVEFLVGTVLSLGLDGQPAGVAPDDGLEAGRDGSSHGFVGKRYEVLCRLHAVQGSCRRVFPVGFYRVRRAPGRVRP